MEQTTLTAEATYGSRAEAEDAATRLLEYRTDEANPVVGGGVHLDGETVHVSLRLHPDASSGEHAKTAAADLQGLLSGGRTKGARAGQVKVTAGAVDLVDEQYVDDAGAVFTRPANRVVHGETGETLTSRVRTVKAIDPETDEELGVVHIRELRGEDGRKVTFDRGDATDQDGRQADLTVTVDEVEVRHTPGE